MQPGPSGKTVLIVDQQPLPGVAEFLEGLGWRTYESADGLDALDRLDQGPVDVVVCDLTAPGMSGIDFMLAVRERDVDVPVVVITDAPTVDRAVQAMEHGAFRYLGKPIAPIELAGVLAAAVPMRRISRNHRQALAEAGFGDGRTDRAIQEAQFARAMASAWIAHQPVVALSERVVIGYEALLRTAEPALARPADLIAVADRLGRVVELGRVVREQVRRSLEQAPPDATLFVNVDAKELEDESLYDPEGPLGAQASRVVLEITDRRALERVKDVAACAARLRRLGFRLALDDLGAGYGDVVGLTLLEPEFVKIDRTLVRGLDASPRRRSIVRAMQRLCTRELGMQVIGLGVQTAAERDALALEGFDLMQGDFFAYARGGFPVPRW